MSKLTTEQWDFITFADQFWRENKCFPDQAEISIGLQINRQRIMEFLGSELVQKHLTARGIDWHQDKPAETKANENRNGYSRRLTDIQLAVASTVLNPADRRPLAKKLETLGVSPATYNGWKKSKTFMNYMRTQSEELFGEAMPEVHNQLAIKAQQGDAKAMKLFYEISGRWRGVQGENQENIKLLIIKFIEVLQRHIEDPEVMAAIAKDIQAIAAGSEQQQVRGELIG